MDAVGHALSNSAVARTKQQNEDDNDDHGFVGLRAFHE
jgi:hypothetical protein